MRIGLKIWIEFSKFPIDSGRNALGKKKKKENRRNEIVQGTQQGRNTLNKFVISGKEIRDSTLKFYLYPEE